MAYTVYLDQNILTELRISKLKTNNFNFVLLAKLLMSKDFQTVYSEHTLTEIDKINNLKFKEQHLETLNYLYAIYWNPRFKDTSANSKDIYKSYKEYKTSTNVQNLEQKHKDFIKSINGIDIGISTRESFEFLVQDLVNKPFSFMSDKFPVFKKPLNYFNKKAYNFIDNKINPFHDIEDYDLSLFIPDLKSIINDSKFDKIELYSPDTVFEEIIRRLVIYDSSFISIFNSLNNDIETKIEFMFQFLNWVGYYPDKFQNITNKKGFHDASILDARHAGVAWHFDYIISSDERFRKKAQACYNFITGKAKVVSLDEFLEIFSLGN